MRKNRKALFALMVGVAALALTWMSRHFFGLEIAAAFLVIASLGFTVSILTLIRARTQEEIAADRAAIGGDVRKALAAEADLEKEPAERFKGDRDKWLSNCHIRAGLSYGIAARDDGHVDGDFTYSLKAKEHFEWVLENSSQPDDRRMAKDFLKRMLQQIQEKTAEAVAISTGRKAKLNRFDSTEFLKRLNQQFPEEHRQSKYLD